MTDVQTREDVQAQATRAPRIRKHKIVVAAIAGGILAAGGIAYSFTSGNKVSTDDAYTDGRAITVAPHVAGYVAALNVTDNQFVHQGQVLVQVQCTDYMAARAHAQGDLESTEGQLASAQSELELAKISYPARFDEAQATLATQRANLFKAQSEFLRQHEIPKEATTSHDVDYATAERNAADGQLAVAQAAKRIAEPVSLNIADAKAHVEQLQGALKRAQTGQISTWAGVTSGRRKTDGSPSGKWRKGTTCRWDNNCSLSSAPRFGSRRTSKRPNSRTCVRGNKYRLPSMRIPI